MSKQKCFCFSNTYKIVLYLDMLLFVMHLKDSQQLKSKDCRKIIKQRAAAKLKIGMIKQKCILDHFSFLFFGFTSVDFSFSTGRKSVFMQN